MQPAEDLTFAMDTFRTHTAYELGRPWREGMLDRMLETYGEDYHRAMLIAAILKLTTVWLVFYGGTPASKFQLETNTKHEATAHERSTMMLVQQLVNAMVDADGDLIEPSELDDATRRLAIRYALRSVSVLNFLAHTQPVIANELPEV